jgi:hypothetical protein
MSLMPEVVPADRKIPFKEKGMYTLVRAGPGPLGWGVGWLVPRDAGGVKRWILPSALLALQPTARRRLRRIQCAENTGDRLSLQEDKSTNTAHHCRYYLPEQTLTVARTPAHPTPHPTPTR